MHTQSRALAAAAVLLVALAGSGCVGTEPESNDGGGGTGTTPTGVGGGTGGSGGGAGAAGGASACNTVVNDAPEVVINQVAEELPTPTGGKIEDGRYHLTAVTVYTGSGGQAGPTGARQKETSVYSDTTLEVAVDLFQGDGEQRFSLDMTIEDQGLVSFLAVCPGPINFPFDRYSFTAPSSLALYYTQSDLELIYTRVGDR
jgi:hypothetical protein